MDSPPRLISWTAVLLPSCSFSKRPVMQPFSGALASRTHPCLPLSQPHCRHVPLLPAPLGHSPMMCYPAPTFFHRYAPDILASVPPEEKLGCASSLPLRRHLGPYFPARFVTSSNRTEFTVFQ
ncbi:Hypothetical predicted protein [Pelobates cultripes]|uniref:Uncharacterized protein n=1 Tax=Pelobates cultripes TaxID=61616 RepID=A0AAD1S7S2_PELCU|nr:Hypothetical predicted protein [Pelobates cultripes]